MTECENAEMRELLPDLVAESIAPRERARVQAHLDGCVACAAELALLRTVRAIRPQVGPVNVAKIVAQLPRPLARAPHGDVRSGVSRRVWRMAAAIGLIIAGSWSVMLVRSGSLTTVTNGRSDTAQLADAVARAPRSTTVPATTVVSASPASPDHGVAVSFGNLDNYTDDELQRVLDRLDKWDGATSTEAVTTTPILAAPRGGAL